MHLIVVGVSLIFEGISCLVICTFIFITTVSFLSNDVGYCPGLFQPKFVPVPLKGLTADGLLALVLLSCPASGGWRGRSQGQSFGTFGSPPGGLGVLFSLDFGFGSFWARIPLTFFYLELSCSIIAGFASLGLAAANLSFPRGRTHTNY